MTTTTTAEPQIWNTYQKLGLRFFMIFFIAYVILEPNGVIPFSDTLADLYMQPLHALIPWLAKHILHLAKPITIFTNGSGDTTYDYLILLFITVLGIIVILIWSVLDRKTKNYNKLYYWLCVIVRYYVAITMVTYGSVKIVKLQFPEPSLGRLLEPVGNMSPMGLAWTYMGYSKGFNYFTGFAEMTCGLLLFFRWTTTLGAIIGLVVAGNIMAINYCFDVPVKLLSTMLVTMCAFLLFRDYRRLCDFFFRNKAAAPSNLSPHRFKARWKNIVLLVIKYALVLYVAIGYMISAVQSGEQYGDNAKKPPMYGIYNVKTFVLGHDTLPPLTTDTTRWSKLLLGSAATTKLMNDSTKVYNLKNDTLKHTLTMYTDADTVHKTLLHYTKINDTLLLKGLWKNDSLSVMLVKFDLNKLRLKSGKFRWINEYPFNK